MAHVDVVQAVEARLKAGFTACEIKTENSKSKSPDNGAAWILVDFPWSKAEQASIGAPGDNWYRETGAFRIVLSVIAGAGTTQGRAWLDEIATLFRGQRFDGVLTFAPQSPSSDDRSDVGSYFRLTMAIPYEFSLRG